MAMAGSDADKVSSPFSFRRSAGDICISSFSFQCSALFICGTGGLKGYKFPFAINYARDLRDK